MYDNLDIIRIKTLKTREDDWEKKKKKSLNNKKFVFKLRLTF